VKEEEDHEMMDTTTITNNIMNAGALSFEDLLIMYHFNNNNNNSNQHSPSSPLPMNDNSTTPYGKTYINKLYFKNLLT
jgi:hypothetical protein